MWKQILAGLLLTATLAPGATRLKELASLEGVRDNQLMGYGVVVGLNGTGDKRQTIFSAQALSNILRRMGLQVDPTRILVNDMAAVMVTATLPPFAQPGTKIDVTVAAMGDATNLQGGLLVLTPLQGADGQVYAAAQGPLITGGFVAGGGANAQTLNHPTVGRIPDGAIVEAAPPSVAPSDNLNLQLRQSDFTTAARVATAINRHFPQADAGDAIAKALSSGLISVRVPAPFAASPVEFVAELEAITVEADHPQKVVINERTGTIVLGKDVRITPVAILHGALSVEVRTRFEVSQPPGFSSTGNTTVTPRVDVNAAESQAQNVVLEEGASVEDLVRALQAIGSTSRDIIAVLQNMRAAGALAAEIDVI